MMFSIIMPVYNASQFVREAMESVVEQTYQDWELICVDDGSTDGSSAILDECAAGDSRITVIHKTNEGVAVARNMGLSRITGEWVTWIDADDVFAPWRLEEMSRIIERERPDLVRTRMLMSERYDADAFERLGYEVLEGEAAWSWGWNELMPMGMLWMFVCKRELFEGNRFISGMRIKEEAPVCARIVRRLSRVVQSESRSYFYRQSAGSAMKSIRSVNDCLRLLDAVALTVREGVSKDTVAKARLRAHCEDDIIDWILKPDYPQGAAEIHEKYEELRQLGVFDAPCLQRWRYRVPMWWFAETGQIWPAQLVERVIGCCRKMRKYLMGRNCV